MRLCRKKIPKAPPLPGACKFSDLFLEDTPHQALFVLIYTKAHVVLHSDLNIHGLVSEIASRLIRVPETSGIGPDFNPIATKLGVNY